MKKFVLIYFLTLSLVTSIIAQVKIYNYVDKNKVHFGTIVPYRITIKHKGDFEIKDFEIYDVLKDTSGVENFVLLDKKVSKKRGLFTKNVTVRYTFNLVPVKLGNVKIGEIQINAVNRQTGESVTLTLPQIEVEVIPYPKPQNKKYDGLLIDIKGQIWVRSYLWLVIILFVITAISVWIIRQYKHKPQQQPFAETQQIDPAEVALKRIEELWQKNYLDQGLIKEFYLELSSIVRWYIEKKHNVNAMELTTEELFNVLKKKTDKRYNLLLKSFLDNADLAKFAKYIPERQQIMSDFETAKKLIMG